MKFCSFVVLVLVFASCLVLPSYGRVQEGFPFKLYESTLKRDSLFSDACIEGSRSLYNNAALQAADARRTCSKPIKNGEEWKISCPIDATWSSACKEAGGRVCSVHARGHGVYGQNDYTANYVWDTSVCAPVACKADDIKEVEQNFANIQCPAYRFTDCKMALTCGLKKSKAPIIAIVVIAVIIIVGVAAAGAFAVWQKKFKNRFATVTSGEFQEYSELAQYEQEDESFIADTNDEDL